MEDRKSRLRVLFVWPGFTGYMGACWRALAKRVAVKVLVEGESIDRHLTDEVMSGVDWERVDDETVIARTLAFAPDAIVVVGWRRRSSRSVAAAKELAGISKYLVTDMPWRWSIRCILARLALGRYVRRFRGVLVHGESSARYARWLGFKAGAIHRHAICGVDLARFAAGSGAADGRRTGFLFVGRQVKEKGIECLRRAYEYYRQRGGGWELTMSEWIAPQAVPMMMRRHACLVLPSEWEPWGVVVGEAKAAGMRIIVSDKVGAREDIVCDEVVRAGDAAALAEAMSRVEQGYDGSAAVDEGIGHLGSEAWAERIERIIREGGAV